MESRDLIQVLVGLIVGALIGLAVIVLVLFAKQPWLGGRE